MWNKPVRRIVAAPLAWLISNLPLVDPASWLLPQCASCGGKGELNPQTQRTFVRCKGTKNFVLNVQKAAKMRVK